jgi:thiol-disulfide isomerase/thioredoxin
MKKILLSTLAVVAISSAFTSAMEAKDDKMMMKDDKMMMSGSMATGSMMKDDKMMMSGAMATGAMMADDKKKMKENKMMEMSDDKKMMDHGMVVSYTAGSITKAIKEGKTVVLDFSASWCPNCVALDKDIAANMAKIPTDVIIIKADFDTATSLKKIYKVKSQNSLVVIKKVKKSTKITKRSSGAVTTLDGLLALVK